VPEKARCAQSRTDRDHPVACARFAILDRAEMPDCSLLVGASEAAGPIGIARSCRRPSASPRPWLAVPALRVPARIDSDRGPSGRGSPCGGSSAAGGAVCAAVLVWSTRTPGQGLRTLAILRTRPVEVTTQRPRRAIRVLRVLIVLSAGGRRHSLQRVSPPITGHGGAVAPVATHLRVVAGRRYPPRPANSSSALRRSSTHIRSELSQSSPVCSGSRCPVSPVRCTARDPDREPVVMVSSGYRSPRSSNRLVTRRRGW
jgi:hypothetical protein